MFPIIIPIPKEDMDAFDEAMTDALVNTPASWGLRWFCIFLACWWVLFWIMYDDSHWLKGAIVMSLGGAGLSSAFVCLLIEAIPDMAIDLWHFLIEAFRRLSDR